MFQLCFNIKKTIEYDKKSLISITNIVLLVVLRKLFSTVFLFSCSGMCMFVCVSVGIHVPWHTWEGQKTTSDVGVPHFLRQTLSCSSPCVLALEGTSGDSLCFCSYPAVDGTLFNLVHLCFSCFTCRHSLMCSSVCMLNTLRSKWWKLIAR